MTTQYNVKKLEELTQANATYRVKGFGGACAGLSTTNIDWQTSTEIWVAGSMVVIEDGHFGDTVNVYVGTKSGSVFTPVAQIYETVYIPVGDSYFHFSAPYPAYIPSGYWFRIAYTNTALGASAIGINLKRHIPLDAT